MEKQIFKVKLAGCMVWRRLHPAPSPLTVEERQRFMEEGGNHGKERESFKEREEGIRSWHQVGGMKGLVEIGTPIKTSIVGIYKYKRDNDFLMRGRSQGILAGCKTHMGMTAFSTGLGQRVVLEENNDEKRTRITGYLLVGKVKKGNKMPEHLVRRPTGSS